MSDEPQAYVIQRLKPNLVFIRWLQSPARNSAAERDFLDALANVLERVDVPQYFISDLRRGRIIGQKALMHLSNLASHAKWGGSTAFYDNPVSAIYAQTFQNLVRSLDEKDRIYERPQQALEFLESLEPGITTDVDWNELLGIEVDEADAE